MKYNQTSKNIVSKSLLSQFLGGFRLQHCHPQVSLLHYRQRSDYRPVEEGRSSHTRLVRGVRRLQSPSEWTEDTDEGLSTPDRPGAGDLALRPLDRPLPFEDFPPPANTQEATDSWAKKKEKRAAAKKILAKRAGEQTSDKAQMSEQ